jgi:hypothetical protein
MTLKGFSLVLLAIVAGCTIRASENMKNHSNLQQISSKLKRMKLSDGNGTNLFRQDFAMSNDTIQANSANRISQSILSDDEWKFFFCP